MALVPGNRATPRGFLCRGGGRRGASADGADIELALDPGMVDSIPTNVSARLLPKTLFGERFVSLELPEDPSPARLADGDVIGQDRTSNAIELQRVIDDFADRAMLLHAQDYIVPLYARFGFVSFGPAYLEAGIMHQSMYRPAGG